LCCNAPTFYGRSEFSHQYFIEATERFWYRKFYTETMKGQLMVLRPDEPLLYFFERPTRDSIPDVTLAVLFRLYALLWVLVPVLAAVASRSCVS